MRLVALASHDLRDTPKSFASVILGAIIADLSAALGSAS
jgi:hypothetical protein